jgi:uncharacterized protein (TIGR03435 family)
MRVAAVLPALAVMAVAALVRPQAQTLSFEVASVKANRSGDLRLSMPPPAGGRFTATNVPLAIVVRFAYGLQDFALVNVPDWANHERFDVNARAEGNPPPADMLAMLRTLLADRFKLATHKETREMPIYGLVLARRDGRLGPALRASHATCAEQPDDIGAGRPLPPARDCNYIGPTPDVPMSSGQSRIAIRGVPIENLARFLAMTVRRPVVNRTGLTGRFDADIDPTMELPPPPPPPGIPDPYQRDQFQTIFSVLPEQLGLRLQSDRAPVDVVVVDHVERPTEN